jgi:hypothetical protein
LEKESKNHDVQLDQPAGLADSIDGTYYDQPCYENVVISVTPGSKTPATKTSATVDATSPRYELMENENPEVVQEAIYEETWTQCYSCKSA